MYSCEITSIVCSKNTGEYMRFKEDSTGSTYSMSRPRELAVVGIFATATLSVANDDRLPSDLSEEPDSSSRGL